MVANLRQSGDYFSVSARSPLSPVPSRELSGTCEGPHIVTHCRCVYWACTFRFRAAEGRPGHTCSRLACASFSLRN